MTIKKIIQINTDRIRAAHDLLFETVKRLNIDLAIIAEPNRKIAEAKDWERDNRGDAALVAFKNNTTLDGIIKGNGFIGWHLGSFTVFSCYISPNCQLADYKRDIDNLWDILRQQRGQILVAGDFNAASQAWGSKKSDHRGKYLLEMVADLDLVILNKGDSPTFERGLRTSRPDITIASQEIAGRICNWEVLDEESMSGHKYIMYEVLENEHKVYPLNGKWNLNKLNIAIFAETIKKQQIETPEDLIEATNRACDSSMPRKKTNKRQEIYWWNNEIAEARQKCIQCRRRLTRENTKKKKKKNHHDQQSALYNDQYKEAKLLLQRLIIKSKNKSWEAVCEEVDQDVWGLGYKIVTKKLKGNPAVQISNENKKSMKLLVYFFLSTKSLRE
ncbi:jg10228 [Pararge aegeria aegeria]|uniref:Jg10228 protein n=1 Tax=Pararge aegeria aegeria TaxID=348720 RepID=A0A8S4QY05_9NEOP|nr:jg10228 [Pararge aegeria aegeria]